MVKVMSKTISDITKKKKKTFICRRKLRERYRRGNLEQAGEWYGFVRGLERPDDIENCNPDFYVMYHVISCKGGKTILFDECNAK